MIESVDDLAGFFDVEEFADLAVYTPVDGAPLPPFPVVHWVATEPETPNVHRFLIRADDVAQPHVADQIVLNDRAFQIAAEPERNRHSAAWWCMAIPLDAELLFQRSTITGEDAFGRPIYTWTEYCRAWAAIIYAVGKEDRTAAQESGSAVATFSIACTDPTASISISDRFLFDGSTWDITSIVPSKRFGRAAFDITATQAAC